MVLDIIDELLDEVSPTMTTTLNVAGRTRRYAWADGKKRLGAEASGLSHGSIVSLNVAGAGLRTVDEYLFTGGSAGMIETAALGTATSTVNVLVGKDTYYGTTSDDITVATDADRGKVWSAYPGGASEYNAAVEAHFAAPIPENKKVRIVYWVKRILDDDTVGGQWKVWRIRSGANQFPETAFFNWHIIGSGAYLDYSPGDVDAGDSRYWQNFSPVVEGEWRKQVLEIDTGSASTPNGTFRVYDYHSTGISVLTSTELTQGSVDVYTGTNRFERFTLQGFVGSGLTPMQIWYDDLAVQIGSWCSVELTNSATYLSSTIAEEQEIVSWDGAGNIQYRLNTGGLSAGTYWEHIRDNTGAVISSRQVGIV